MKTVTPATPAPTAPIGPAWQLTRAVLIEPTALPATLVPLKSHSTNPGTLLRSLSFSLSVSSSTMPSSTTLAFLPLAASTNILSLNASPSSASFFNFFLSLFFRDLMALLDPDSRLVPTPFLLIRRSRSPVISPASMGTV